MFIAGVGSVLCYSIPVLQVSGELSKKNNKMSEAYEAVGGSLKLKGVKDGGVKKKLVRNLYYGHSHCSTCSFIVWGFVLICIKSRK